MNIVLTGATGFVGSRVLESLSTHKVRVIGRTRPNQIDEKLFFPISIDAQSDYSTAFQNTDVVIHCAARAHVMNDKSADPLSAFREINTIGTINLARQAANSGVKRFIFISSVKVNGEASKKAYSVDDAPQPEDPYGLSKAEAEALLKELGNETGMQIVIIRPPLIYGPGVKANFKKLLELTSKGFPLPFGSVIENRRSMIFIDNLVDFILICMTHPKAANETFLISDCHDLSTGELLRQLSFAFGKKPRLVPVPVSVLSLLGKLSGKPDLITRLCGSLQVDTSKANVLLNWAPPFSVGQAFKITANHYINNK